MKHLLRSTAVLAALTISTHALAESGILYKDKNCPCCEKHAEYLKQNGIEVEVTPVEDIATFSKKAGIPSDYQGCHTIMMDGYAIEGHVSVELIRKLLKEHPADVVAIAIPGMPADVPGMNGPNKDEPVTVYAIKADGTASVFGTQ
jgi:hypothetical protein